MPEQRRLDRRVTAPVLLAACRQAAVGRALPAQVRQVARAQLAVVVVLEHRAELAHLQPAVRSAAAVVVQAAAAAAQTRSMRSS
jgi:hypothetical protein